MTLGDMAKIGITSVMTNTILKRLATKTELENGSDELIDVNIIAVTLFGKDGVVYSNQYNLLDIQFTIGIDNLYEFFVTVAVSEYKEVL
jgi:hypothetical protein